MSNVNMPKWMGGQKQPKKHSSSSSKEYVTHGYDKDGRGYSKKNSFSAMQGYTSGNASDTGYNRRREPEYHTHSHESPFANDRNDSSHYDEEYYGEQYSNAAFEDNTAADQSGASGSVPAMPAFTPVAQNMSDTKSGWSIRSEPGMQVTLSIMFSGAPAHFSKREAPLTRGSTDTRTFNPTIMNFDEKTLRSTLRSSAKAAELTTAEASGIAQNAVKNNTIVPLGLHVGSYHNPFSFPVGVRATHEPLNQIVSRSGQKFMVVLMPGSHNADYHVNVRDTLNQNKLIHAARLTDIKPESFMLAQSAGSPFVSVEKESMLHSGITVASQRGKCTPVNWANVKEDKVFEKTYLTGIPRAAAEYAITQIKNTAKQNHGSQPISKIAFEIHPLNYQEKWDGHHLSGAGYDAEANQEVYSDFIGRPVDIVINGTLEYL